MKGLHKNETVVFEHLNFRRARLTIANPQVFGSRRKKVTNIGILVSGSFTLVNGRRLLAVTRFYFTDRRSKVFQKNFTNNLK